MVAMTDQGESISFKGIELSSLTDEEVIFFIRIRGRDSYFREVYGSRLIEAFQSLKKHRCISEYKRDADIHIDLNAVPRDYLYQDEYDTLNNLVSYDEIIKRCRGLRSIPYTEACKLIARAYLFFEGFYIANPQLKLIVTGEIDNYVMDLMVRIGERHRVRFLGLTASLMSPEYQLCVVRGELTPIENSDNYSVDTFKEKVLRNLENGYKNNIKEICSRVIYSVSSYIYRVLVRYFIKYRLFGRLEYEYRFAPYLYGFKSFSQIFALRHLAKEHELTRSSASKKAYIPLHWYPEATTDYWIKSLYHVDYFSSVMDTIRLLQGQGYAVFAKEHPHFLLAREGSFYKALNSVGCTVLSPTVKTKDVFDNVDLVVVWNGSTGIESLLYGMLTLRVVNSYYGDGLIETLGTSGSATTALPPVTTDIAGHCIEKVYQSSFRTY